MGNCLKISMKRRDEDENMEHHQEDWKEASDGEQSAKKSGGLKVKIVLTREELEWLMLKLQVNENKNTLEELLREIERGREKVKTTWKPSLESIKESPEAVEMER
ncbi:hypothetical protein K2173_010385 [Erythroxylum novogranatense]|uniref:Uncharacterized protein n=1 Tax=Erythroxylum novogranatense TaxID=1862640 RepID=A0AAV8TDQ7_9ROSI|nr:hypothetical protein K2173_010385 [Erythroxylum novogranatense]